MKMRHWVALFAMLIIMISVGVCASAANMTAIGEVNGNLSLPKDVAEAHKYYEYQIEMTDDNDKYTFKRPTTSDGFQDGVWPAGLTISETGLLSGTMLRDGVFIDIRVLVTSKEDGTRKILTCKLTVNKRQVIAVVEGGSYPYDGGTHEATVVLKDLEGNVLNVNPQVTYSGLAEGEILPRNVGTYGVNVTSPTGCTITNTVTSSITITPITIPSITLRDKSVPYTGQPQGIDKSEVIVTPSAEFVIEYQDPETSEYTETRQSASGRYNVRVRTTDRNMPVTYAYATFTILPEEIDFTVTPASVTYNGSGQEPEVTTARTDVKYSVSYTDENNQPVDGKPVNAGTYNIVITFENSDRYAVGSITSRTFTINQQEVTFKIPIKSYPYEEGKSYSPVVEPSIEGFDLYTVQYQLLDDNSQPTGELLSEISAMGTYNVIFTLTDPVNYKLGTGNAQSVQVASQTINFTFTDLNKEYNGEPQYATVTPDKEEYIGHYDVVYTQNNVPVEKPTAAGSYYITIRPKTGYGTGTKTPEYPYLVIAPKPITFEVTKPTVEYNGSAQTTTLSNSENITSGYTVKYRDESGKLSDEVTDVGVYDVLVTVTNSNYSLENSLVGTFTVETSISLGLGNSPAAMIYKDIAHINEPEWQTTAHNELVNNRKFGAGYVPAGCSTDIPYNKIDNLDLDGDVNTIIVDDIADFADADTGIQINGRIIKGSGSFEVDTPYGSYSMEVSEPVQVSDNLYKVTYFKMISAGSEVYAERYIMVVGKIGDTNGDGYINAVDANKLDGLNAVPLTVDEARVWDVNKDGKIDSKDAEAIRYRFRTKLTSYYPWVK